MKRRERQRAVAGEQIAAHRRSQQLGDLAEIVGAAVRVHLAAGDNQRQRRARQQIRRAPHRVGVRVQRGVGLRPRARQNLGAREALLP